MFYASCIFAEKKYLKPHKIEKKGNSFFYIVSFRAYFVHLCLFIFSSRFPKIRAEVIQRIQKTGGNKMIVSGLQPGQALPDVRICTRHGQRPRRPGRLLAVHLGA